MEQGKTLAFEMNKRIPILVDGELLYVRPIKLEILSKALIVKV